MLFRVRFFCVETFCARLRLITIIPRGYDGLGNVSFFQGILNFLKLQVAVLRHQLCFPKGVGFPRKMREEVSRALLRGLRADEERGGKHANSQVKRLEHLLPLFFFQLTSKKTGARGGFEIHVAGLFLVERKKFLIGIERLGHQPKFIVTGRANE